MDLKAPRSLARAWAGGSPAIPPPLGIRVRLLRLSPEPKRYGPLPASLLLHGALIALLLVSFQRRQPDLALPLNGVSVVFEGTPEAGAVDTGPRRAPTARPLPSPGLPPPPPAPSPPLPLPPPSPPAPRTAQAEPEVHLSPLPSQPFQPPEPEAPRFVVPPPQTHKSPPALARRQRPDYLVMNDMSFGNARSPSLNPGRRGLELTPANDDQTQRSDLVEVKGHVGSGWDSALQRWAQEHGYYPEAAARLGQQGEVTVDLVIDRSGRVISDRLVKGSKSAFLNMAWFGLWRDAKVPPFPPGTKDDTVTVRFTARYMLIPR